MREKLLILLFIVPLSLLGQAPQAGTTTPQKNMTVQDRYNVMKGNAQTFKDYKVIKETVLDGVWKITMDSLAEKRKKLMEANSQIQKQSLELKEAKETVRAKDEELNEFKYDSDHITFLGIGFHKGLFILIVLSITGGLIFLLTAAVGRMRLLEKSLKEKKKNVEDLTREYETFRKNSLDKQMKLSRELQDERNKLEGLKAHQ